MRHEIKYLITCEQLEKLKDLMPRYAEEDEYGRSVVCSIYYDTPDYLLIRRSLEKPVYKEKLRVRSYGVAKDGGEVFVELKKKYMDMVYKRRIAMTENQSTEFLQKRSRCADSQIAKEIDYALDYYKTLRPAVQLSYKREAYAGKENSGFRITFDSEILYRTYDLSLKNGIYGSPLLADGRYLMEIKTADSIPVWLADFLTREKIMKTSFSKYGSAYLDIYGKKKRKEVSYA